MLYNEAVNRMNKLGKENIFKITKSLAESIEAWESNTFDVDHARYLIVDLNLGCHWRVDALDKIANGEYQIHYHRPYFSNGINFEDLVLSSETQSSHGMCMSVSYGKHSGDKSKNELHIYIYPQIDINTCKGLCNPRE